MVLVVCQIVMLEMGVVGLIGVVIMYVDFLCKLEQDGIKVILILFGKYKMDGNLMILFDDVVWVDM